RPPGELAAAAPTAPRWVRLRGPASRKALLPSPRRGGCGQSPPGLRPVRPRRCAGQGIRPSQGRAVARGSRVRQEHRSNARELFVGTVVVVRTPDVQPVPLEGVAGGTLATIQEIQDEAVETQGPTGWVPLEGRA